MSTRKHTFKTQGNSAAPARVLQRKCACGGGAAAGLTGKCDECDRNALTLQRRERGPESAGAVPPIVYEVLRSPGQPLDSGTRAFMESRFGHSFGRVRVHADARAAESAQAVNAAAYTVGRDVVFGAGRYAPGTSDGRRLLAHELAHTIQQGGGEPPPAGGLQVADARGPAEREAEQTAAEAGAERASPLSAAPQAVARQPKEAPKGGETEPAKEATSGACLGTPPPGVTLKPLTPAQEAVVEVAEHIRKLILSVAAGALLNLIARIVDGDPELRKPKGQQAPKTAAKPAAAPKTEPAPAAATQEGKAEGRFRPNDSHTIRTVRYFFDFYDAAEVMFDWPNTEKSRVVLSSIMQATQLFLENAKMQKTHRARSSCEEGTFACATTPMTLCPVFFGKLGEAYKDPLYPARVITHEYFHYLKTPSTQKAIFHGETVSLQAPTYQHVLANAHSLTNLAIRLSLGRDVD